MQLTTDMIEYCEAQPWDEDHRQEVYIKVMEYKGEPSDVNDAWLSRMYTNHMHNVRRDEARRVEILDGLTGESLAVADPALDPMEILMAEEALGERTKGMTALMEHTLTKHYIEGKSIAEIAEEEGEDNVTIRVRLNRGRNILKGEAA
jgi:DNA-directed RNA polymerase specialized sigma24 family protein